MTSKDYVLKHDYGYGKEPEQEILNKLNLRNFDDLNVYVNELINSMFVAKVDDGIIEFFTNNSKTKVIIEKI